MNRYFKGWYFKAENDHQALAVIPAMHVDEHRNKSASVQIVTESGAWNVRFPFEQFDSNGNKPRVKIRDNMFSERGLKLNINSESVSAYGILRFGPLSPLSYDIMGPFHFVPFMECRHSVFSMTHTVDGWLYVNNEKYRFSKGVGYMEGDRGRSFPKEYAWTQCNFFDETPNSLMLSVAEIPFGAIRFTGIIGAVLWHGKEYRIATYLGARAETIKDGTIVVKQGKLRFAVKLIKKRDNLLYAPVGGSMKRMIHESLSCIAQYCLEKNGEKMFEFTSDRAAFEYEYDS